MSIHEISAQEIEKIAKLIVLIEGAATAVQVKKGLTEQEILSLQSVKLIFKRNLDFTAREMHLTRFVSTKQLLSLKEILPEIDKLVLKAYQTQFISEAFIFEYMQAKTAVYEILRAYRV